MNITPDQINAAIEGCQDWFSYLERQEQRALTLQKAASAARKGDTETARRLKSSVDSGVTVYDGAQLEPAVRALVALAAAVMADHKAGMRMVPCGAVSPMDNAPPSATAKILEGEI